MPWQPGNRITDERLNHPEPEQTASGFTIATGWTLVSFTAQRISGLVSVQLDVARDGATLTGDSQGNITPDELLGTVPTGWRPYHNQRGTYTRADVNFGSFRLESDGQVWVVSTIAGGTILGSTNVRLSSSYHAPPP